MLIVKAVYVGNQIEAYIERRFSPRLNIMFSDDNHVGKTIVIQALMYAMGSDAGFPPTFPIKECYCAVDLEDDGREFSIMRQGNTFAVAIDGSIRFIESVAEFRIFWNKEVGALPSIVKNGRDHVVYLSLFNQMFFTPQSDRSSSRLVNQGQYAKADFPEMIASIKGLGGREIDEQEKVLLKEKRDELIAHKKRLAREIAEFNSSDPALAVSSSAADRVELEKTIRQVDGLQEEIAILQRERNRLRARRNDYSSLVSELNGLSEKTRSAELVCLECGSTKIGLVPCSSSKMTFDVTTKQMRDDMKVSLSQKILHCEEEMDRVGAEIASLQSKLTRVIAEKSFTIRDVMAYQGDIVNIAEIDAEYSAVCNELAEIDDRLAASEKIDAETAVEREELFDRIVGQMNAAHRVFDDEEQVPYEGLMTKNNSPFKGSEETEYFLCRSYALAIVLQHKYPIVIDSFRAEDLSSSRERKALSLFKPLPNQVIFTTTIKDEEHSKYADEPDINVINYSGYKVNKLLQPTYACEMTRKLASFGLIVNVEEEESNHEQ